MDRIIVIPDLQVPLHDKRFVRNLLTAVAWYGPDQLLCVGDEFDSPQTGRWSKGAAQEYDGTLQAGLREAHNVMGAFREALGANKPFHVSRSNHVDRTETYVRRYAPALSSVDALRIEQLLGYPELEIKYHRQPYEFAPGWVLCHGDEGNLVSTPGGTALSLAKKFGKSVVCGHTHRAGIQPVSEAFGGRVGRTLYGVEVGHAMDLRQASYLRGQTANWQQAFGLLYVDGSRVDARVIYARPDGSFNLEGREF